MSVPNVYLTEVLVAERHHELLVEAQQQHLARLARGHRQPWWRRLSGLTGPSDRQPRSGRVAPALSGTAR